MTSTLDVTIAAERHLVHHRREGRNRLNTDYTAGDTAMTLEFSTPLPSRGQLLAVDFEVFEVWDRTNQAVTVEGAQEGSTAANHSTAAHVILDPKFPRNTIVAEVNNELADLSSPTRGLFRMVPKDITYQANVFGYDLAADFLELYDVAWRPIASTKRWEPIPLGECEVRSDRDLSTVDFPSGNAIFLPGGINAGYTVRVTYKAAFASVTATTTDVAVTSGLPATALDVLDLGAAVRLLAPLEPARNYIDAQGDSRRADEVPPGAEDRSVRALQALRDDRIKAEAARLRQAYPARSRR